MKSSSATPPKRIIRLAGIAPVCFFMTYLTVRALRARRHSVTAA